MTPLLVQELLLILAAGLLAGVICRRLSISMLIGYLLAGVLLGDGVLGWISDHDHQLEHFAEVGVFLLLFSIGLEFSIEDLKRLGSKLFIAGATQMAAVALPAMLLLKSRGMDWQTSILIATAVAFSSTVLVFKALSEWGQASRPHGRRAIGILLFQDAALVPLLLLVPLLTDSEEPVRWYDFALLAAFSALFIVAIFALRHLLARWLIPFFTSYRVPELVILFTVVCLGGITLAAYSIGLPAAVGAFAAGLVFNGNRWSHQIDAIVLSFRETFAAVFFVSLGLIFDPRLLVSEPLFFVLALLGLILLKACAATLALRLTGLSLATSFGAAIGLAHVGEFAFVLILLGWESGIVPDLDYQKFVGVAVGSLILTPALMKLGLRLVRHEEESEEDRKRPRPQRNDLQGATVIGAGPIGRAVASQLETTGKQICLIDRSPLNLHPFALAGFQTIAGDATDSDILQFANIEDSSTVVVCISDDAAALRIVKAVKKFNKSAHIIVRSRYQVSVKDLLESGADRVISDESEASVAILRAIESATSPWDA